MFYLISVYFTCFSYILSVRYASYRPANTLDGDIWDGSVLKDLTKLQRLSTAYLGTCSDGAVFRNWLGTSYTPVCAQLFNLHVSVRRTFAGLFLIAVFPPKTKDMFNFLYEFVLNRLQSQSAAFTGFPVEWGDTSETTQMTMKIVNDIQDVKGLPCVMCCKTTGGYVGACPWCKTVGIRDRTKTVYPTAVSFLPTTNLTHKRSSPWGNRGPEVRIAIVLLLLFNEHGCFTDLSDNLSVFLLLHTRFAEKLKQPFVESNYRHQRKNKKQTNNNKTKTNLLLMKRTPMICAMTLLLSTLYWN
jgi:hypothetical protein